MEYNQIIQGDSLTVLKTLPDESVNCCVTSPPYWSLRDYGIEGQLGLEKTFEEYITKLCDTFDEVKRVLRKDGTCWVNLGDSYNSHTFGNSILGGGLQKKLVQKEEAFPRYRKPPKNLGDKSLCLIPQRFAIEMVNRGWICRNTIIWHKPNCMPSSAKDRFTVDFEYVYFFVKSKKYWFEQAFEEHQTKEYRPDGIVRNRIFNYDSKENNMRGYKTKNPTEEIQSPQHHGGNINYGANGRNKRAVWTIPTRPFPEAHFAVYPEALIEPMIQAGCPRYVCKKCGKAREKIYKTTINEDKVPDKWKKTYRGKVELEGSPTKRSVSELYAESLAKEKDFIGYTDCGCNAGFEGGVVLDPFIGSGTTAKVAKKQGKRYLGIELKQEYIDMANKRIRAVRELLF